MHMYGYMYKVGGNGRQKELDPYTAIAFSPIGTKTPHQAKAQCFKFLLCVRSVQFSHSVVSDSATP